MNALHRMLLAAISAAFFIASAQAQNAGTVTQHAFAIGKGAGVQGSTSLLCASAQLAVGQAAADPICQTITGDATLSAIGALTVTKTNGAPFGPFSTAAVGAANTIKGSLNGSTLVDLGVPSCSAAGQVLQYTSGTGFNCASGATASPVLSSRTFAISQNLSNFSSVKTLGYASPGDGGEATFIKVSAGAPFTDQYLTPGSYTPTTAGSGLVNGTYLGVPLPGGSGIGCSGQVVVAGNVATQINTSVPCPGYKVGDTIQPANNSSIGGAGTVPTYTIAAIASATGSFTDNAGNLFQISPSGFPNALQFGAVHDWNGTDAGATNNRLSFLSSISFAMYPASSAGALVNGNTVILPKGGYMYCGGTLPVPAGVKLHGAGKLGGTTLAHCAGDNVTVDGVYLCDIYALSGQMGCDLEELSLFDESTSNSSATRAIYSTAAQQFPSLTNVYIQTVNKGCLSYDFGRGGAANFITQGVDCERSGLTSGNNAVNFGPNIGGTLLVMSSWNFGVGGGNMAAGTYAISVQSGGLQLGLGSHIEEYHDAISIATANGLSTIRDTSITTGCVNGITLAGTNPNNTVLVESIQSGCSTATVLNGHSGGTSTTGNINGQKVYNP